MDKMLGMDVSQPIGHLYQRFNLVRHLLIEHFFVVNVVDVITHRSNAEF
jgi:hypothetical protein